MLYIRPTHGADHAGLLTTVGCAEALGSRRE